MIDANLHLPADEQSAQRGDSLVETLCQEGTDLSHMTGAILHSSSGSKRFNIKRLPAPDPNIKIWQSAKFTSPTSLTV